MMFALLVAAALQISAWNDTPEQSWSAHANAGHTSVTLRTIFRQRTDRGTWDDERSVEIPAAELSARLPGFTSDQLFSDSPQRVHFVVAHDAGKLDYTGNAGDGNASGDFTVTPNPQFAVQLQRRGIGTATVDQQRELTLMGADYAYLDLLAKQGFERPSVAQFVQLLEHAVSADYLRGMAALHLTPHQIETIVRARDHGVTPDYARNLINAGYASLSIDDLIRARDHGVDAEMVAAFKAAGYKDVPMEQLVRLRDHGVNAEFIAGMKGFGYFPTAGDLVRLRDHDVSPDYVRALKDLGYANLKAEDLIRLRDHGVSPDYVSNLRRRGYTAKLSVDDLIRLRDHGI